MAVIRVDNPDVQSSLLNGEFGGVSLSNRVKAQCAKNLHGQIKYSDLKDAECVIPLLISFVEEGANGVPLLVMDYEVYIKKSKNGDNRMSFLDELKSLIAKEESKQDPTITKSAGEEPIEEPEEPVIVKEDKKEESEAKEEEEKEEEEEATVEKDAVLKQKKKLPMKLKL